MIEYKLYVIDQSGFFYEHCGTVGFVTARLAEYGKTRIWQIWNAAGTKCICSK